MVHNEKVLNSTAVACKINVMEANISSIKAKVVNDGIEDVEEDRIAYRIS